MRQGDQASRGSILLGAWWCLVAPSARVEAESTSQSIPLRFSPLRGCGKTGPGAAGWWERPPGQAEQGRCLKHRYPEMQSWKVQSNRARSSLEMLVTTPVGLPWVFLRGICCLWSFPCLPVVLFLRPEEFLRQVLPCRCLSFAQPGKCVNPGISRCGYARALSALMAPSRALRRPWGI